MKPVSLTAPPLPRSRPPLRATEEGPLVRWTLIAVTLLFFALFLALPLVAVFAEAFRKGWALYLETFRDPASLHAIRLSLLVAAIVVPINTVFGVVIAWAVSRFNFRGKSLLIVLVDLPLWVSPVIAGLMYVLLFGAESPLGPWLRSHGIKIIFATPGMVLATLFVTFPLVARTLIPLMQAQGVAEEEAALTLGARGWQIFFRITLPKIRWGLLYGVILCNARALGEFGAVSVVSGHIRGLTNTIPLQIEILYNEYAFSAAFALASLLSLLALATLGIKSVIDRRTARQLAAGEGLSTNPDTQTLNT
ncbi:MAG TPA: sulfate ABC transporter permease subunit CysW [Chthoniobacteraceae bacterium]|nr:sulfate ABC transporter permease subunit CysW [Chthoniobacteraceae bacterium]